MRRPGLVFGEVAEDYDRVRPGVPVALVDRVFAYGVPPGPALEMGAGTGKATAAFAWRGREITAIEPDPAMARFLRGARVVPKTFEEFVPDRLFSLLYASDAWHWTDPETRWVNAAHALGPGGVLALILHGERVDDRALRKSIVDAYAAVAPHIEIQDERPVVEDRWQFWPGDELAAQESFGEREVHVFPGRIVRSAEDHLAHMATRSHYRMLPPEVQARLGAALREVVRGEVTLTSDAVLYLARRV